MDVVMKKDSKASRCVVNNKVSSNSIKLSKKQVTASHRKSQVTASRQKSPETMVFKKRVKIYKNGDDSFEGLEFIIDMEQFKSMQALLDTINEKIDLTNGAKKLYTLSGELIQSMDEINDHKEYVASANIFTPLLYGQMKFIVADAEILKKNSEITSPESTKPMPLRISRSIDSRKERRKESMPQKKSKSSAPSESRLSVENNLPKDKRKEAKRVVKKNTVATDPAINLSQSTKATATKFASISSTPSSLPTTKRSKTPKLTVKMDPAALPKYPFLSTGQRPSTTSIKNRTPTPKPGGKIRQSDKDNASNIGEDIMFSNSSNNK